MIPGLYIHLGPLVVTSSVHSCAVAAPFTLQPELL